MPVRGPRLAFALASLLLVAGAGAAGAQEPDAQPPGAPETGIYDVDEAVSPSPPKETALWTQIAGAAFGERSAPPDTPTPHEADLYTVRFRNEQEGIAAGSVCRDPVDPAAHPSDEEFVAALAECERVPVIYSIDPIGAGVVEAYRSSEPGYVGAVAWLGRGRALAVGGSGSYPEREHAREPGESYEEWVARDPAGEPRAWLFEGGTWTEISDLPAAMRGLNALDAWIGRDDSGAEYAVAGGLGQLWEWRGGRFTDRVIDRDSSAGGAGADRAFPSDGDELERSVAGAELFRYRVREVRFAPDADRVAVFAYTAGCCGPDEEGGSRLIAFDPTPLHASGGNQAGCFEERPHWTVSRDDGDSVYSFGVLADEYSSFSPPCPRPENGTPRWRVGATVNAPAAPEAATAAEPRFVSSDGDVEQRPPPALVTSTSGTPPRADGVPDWKAGEYPAADDGLGARGLLETTVLALRPEFGGLEPYCGRVDSPYFWNYGPDNEVGYGPTELLMGDSKGLYVCRVEQIQSGELPSLDPSTPVRQHERGDQLAPTYALHGVELLDDAGTGYAVGERGAILTLTPVVEDPPPPRLGAAKPGPLADRAAYEPLLPSAAGTAGVVPSLAEQPLAELERPRLVPYGSPDAAGAIEGRTSQAPEIQDVREMVMSRDGSEGWAIGPSVEAGNGAVLTLFHWDGRGWERCDPFGVPGQVEPDPACEELGPLVDYRPPNGAASGAARVQLLAAARVPYEYDSDPSNDDRFEVVAIGTRYRVLGEKEELPVVLRYEDGRWRLESEAVRRSLYEAVGQQVGTGTGTTRALMAIGRDASELAFAGPEDGWLVPRVQGGTTNVVTNLVRFDGERFFDCSLPGTSAACEDPGGRLAGVDVDTLATAGERVYLAGSRGRKQFNANSGPPVILYRDPGDPAGWRADGGGWDPGRSDPDTPAGRVHSLALARRADGLIEGWAVADLARGIRIPFSTVDVSATGSPLLRLEAGSETWEPFSAEDAARDYMAIGKSAIEPSGPHRMTTARQLTLPGSAGAPGGAYVSWRDSPLLLELRPEEDRWQLLENELLVGGRVTRRVQALAPDGVGGVWAAVGTGSETALTNSRSDTYFYRYTDHPHEEVFEETPSPATDGATISTLSGAADGSLWIGTDAGHVYRYDRALGWERAEIPGWDPGRIVTRRSPVHAVAVGPDGAGVAVGSRGRIATLEPDGVRLDRASGTACEDGAPDAPCASGHSLRAAAVAPDGSAIAGGDGRSVLWRPPGGGFRPIAEPPTRVDATITGASMPEPGRAWLTTDAGQVFAGTLAGGGWSWRLENVNADGDLLSRDAQRRAQALRAVSVDASGRGFAVGDGGVVLARDGEGEGPWRRIDAGVATDLTAVALPSGSGAGALVGGKGGLVLTLSDGGLEVARHSEPNRGAGGPVVGLALLAGAADGQTEAWTAIGGPSDPRPGASQLLHYASETTDPLLAPSGDVEPLPDVPEPRQGELSFAAFGRSDCHNTLREATCPELLGSGLLHEVLARRVRDELAARSERSGGPTFALHTGDAYDSPGATGQQAIADAGGGKAAGLVGSQRTIIAGDFSAFVSGAFKYRRFNEQVLDPLASGGLPVFGAIGTRDLSESRACAPLIAVCPVSNREQGRVGENQAWRQAMASHPAPWGEAPAATAGSTRFVAVGDEPAAEPEDVVVDVDQSTGVEDPSVSVAGARTHYAFDVVDDAQGGARLARVVVVDTSTGSLASSDATGGPPEAGGQAAWLERVLCFSGSTAPTGEPCTRDREQRAIVLSSTPTYSYGPGALVDTQADAATLEAIAFRYDVDVVVSGKLGWNGLYWALAPGVHTPCPGGRYPAGPPEDRVPECGGAVDQAEPPGLDDVPAVAGDPADQLGGAIPFVVASTAGGRFGPDGQAEGEASEGYWRGYTVVRLDPSGDPRRTIVEQRPIFDWIGLSARERALGPRARLTLEGYGREPIGLGHGSTIEGAARFDRIDSAAITHRYDLLLADPEQPWLPCREGDSDCESLATNLAAGAASGGEGEAEGEPAEDRCAPYLCLPERVGTVDRTTGEVRAGDGRYPNTFALALLSVGERAASYPMVFEKSPSFVVRSQLRTLGAPLAARGSAPAPPPPPEPPTPPRVPQIDLPAIPEPPAIAPMEAAQPPEPTPPAPPAPPPPAEQPAALDLSVSPAGLTVATPAAVIQPPTPPVNPAPPSGARREARQRQAAAQKSGADADQTEGSEETQGSGGDLADGRLGAPGAEMTRRDAPYLRRDRIRPEPSFTTYRPAADSSPLGAGALYASGLTLLAFALAAGWSRGRPTPRRREPELPAPAWSRGAGRRR